MVYVGIIATPSQVHTLRLLVNRDAQAFGGPDG